MSKDKPARRPTAEPPKGFRDYFGAEVTERKAMLDQIAGTKKRIANLCFRGAAKTTLMFEYLILYVAVFGEIDGFGKIDGRECAVLGVVVGLCRSL